MRASVAVYLVAVLLACSNFAASSIVDTVLTPGGYRPQTHVHAIPDGGSLAHVGSDIHILTANGSLAHIVPTTSGSRTKVRKDFQSGWIAFAIWVNDASAPISSLTTSWIAPPEPETYSGQTVFLFNGLQPATTGAILQPVLQYGPSNAGGGPYWSLASWYVDDTGHAFFTTLVNTTAGASLNTVVTLTNSTNSSFTYTSQFSNVPGTSISITRETPLAVAAETLEAYGVTKGTDYPAGSTVFADTDLAFGETEGRAPEVAWNTFGDDADGVTAKVDRDGASGAQITITY
ncbi:hypothetical protein DFH06DRAFT_171367 [Mycena polygramma]|nr:hypothetical protein DFH06DRAFT_171367 [Mycena polygramma]